jgi:hypothetical protein
MGSEELRGGRVRFLNLETGKACLRVGFFMLISSLNLAKFIRFGYIIAYTISKSSKKYEIWI